MDGSVLILGGVGAGAAYLLTASWFVAAVCFLIGQMISFADFSDSAKPRISGLKKC